MDFQVHKKRIRNETSEIWEKAKKRGLVLKIDRFLLAILSVDEPTLGWKIIIWTRLDNFSGFSFVLIFEVRVKSSYTFKAQSNLYLCEFLSILKKVSLLEKVRLFNQ